MISMISMVIQSTKSTKADEVVLEFLGRLDGQVLGSFLNAVVSKGFQDGSPQK